MSRLATLVDRWCLQWGALLVFILSLLTWLGQRWAVSLGPAAMAMLYLLCVLLAAYVSRVWLALLTALLAGLLLNYFFIEPRYTWQIGAVQSWLLLAGFALVALTVSSSIAQLKAARRVAEQAQTQAALLQALAERGALCHTEAELWPQACQVIMQHMRCQAAVLHLDDRGQLQHLAGAALAAVPASAVAWALDYARPIGPGTADWPDLPVCLLPLDTGHKQVLCVSAPSAMADLACLRLMAHQLAERGQRLRQQQATLAAEQRATAAEFKKMLLTALSHDMRTPLTALLGAVNVLTDPDLTLDAGQQQSLRAAIQAESAFLTLATENILTLVMLESGAAHVLQPDWQAPQDIARHVLTRYQTRLPGQIHYQDTAGEALLYGDARLVAHALANLLDNACKYQTPGTPVTLLTHVDAAHIGLTVRNHGPAFPPGFEILAFARPQGQADPARGFGLGLMIVQQIMQAHDGQLRLASDHGETAVSLLFPRRVQA